MIHDNRASIQKALASAAHAIQKNWELLTVLNNERQLQTGRLTLASTALPMMGGQGLSTNYHLIKVGLRLGIRAGFCNQLGIYEQLLEALLMVFYYTS